MVQIKSQKAMKRPQKRQERKGIKRKAKNGGAGRENESAEHTGPACLGKLWAHFESLRWQHF